jgi:hypothetical protein
MQPPRKPRITVAIIMEAAVTMTDSFRFRITREANSMFELKWSVKGLSCPIRSFHRENLRICGLLSRDRGVTSD